MSVDASSPCYKKRKTGSKIEEINPKISCLKETELDILGLLYEKEHVSGLEVLLNKTLCYDSKIPKHSSKIQPLARVLDYFLDFDASEYQEAVDEGTDRVTRFKEDVNNIKLSLTKAKETTFETVRHLLPDDISSDEDYLRGMFEAVKWNGIYGFGENLIYFMLENRKGTSNDMVCRQLFRDFFVMCGLNLMDGESKNKSMKIGKSVVTSHPELRCCSDEITELNMKTVMVVGGVKQRKVTLPSAHDFKIEDLNPYDIIEQHGANLLLEIQDSCFEKTGDEEDGRSLVFGAICVGTQVIFTALEMNKSHTHAIKQLEREDLNKVIGDDNVVETSSISYTRPYNILKAADRSEMYEPLLRLACYQHQIT
ncbi:uncharacterized protein [Mytilus edulis]|uniref:uncharacterized protein isoform X1 n=1 Tax=Mytilus edulis TaxID=6550 RepID=UPI0039F09333